MRYLYFTKSLPALEVPALIAFFKEAGLNGADFAVRPGFPVTPDNAPTELPRAAEAFRSAGLPIGLVTAPTNLNDPASPVAQSLFEACGKAGVPALKLGYFGYTGNFEASLTEARRRLAGFARLAEKTGVRACVHTHSGNYVGNNCASLRMLLRDSDPHHVGAFVDTGHLAINGGPFRMELDLVRDWLALVAIKDMRWERGERGWQSHVVPAGEGIVRWTEVAAALKERHYDGVISLHAEYETKDLTERKLIARRELDYLRRILAE